MARSQKQDNPWIVAKLMGLFSTQLKFQNIYLQDLIQKVFQTQIKAQLNQNNSRAILKT